MPFRLTLKCIFPSSLTVNPYAWQMNDSAVQRFCSIPACSVWTLLEYTNPSTTASGNVTWISERTCLKIYCYQVGFLAFCGSICFLKKTSPLVANRMHRALQTTSCPSILIPIAFFASFSRRGLGTRIERLWR